FPESNEVYLGNPVGGTFEVSQLAAIINGASEVITDTDAERFRKMQRIYLDQVAIVDNWLNRQERVDRVLQQLGVYIETQLNDMLTISNWLEANLGEDPED